MAGSVRTGGKGTMRRYYITVEPVKIQSFCVFKALKFGGVGLFGVALDSYLLNGFVFCVLEFWALSLFIFIFKKRENNGFSLFACFCQNWCVKMLSFCFF